MEPPKPEKPQQVISYELAHRAVSIPRDHDFVDIPEEHPLAMPLYLTYQWRRTESRRPSELAEEVINLHHSGEITYTGKNTPPFDKIIESSRHHPQ